MRRDRHQSDGGFDGMLDDATLADWCGRSLGTRPVAVLFRTGHLAQVVGVELANGSSAVIKVRLFESRIAGCVAAQDYLARAGFPCPEPLAGPEIVDGCAVTAESLVSGGEQLPPERGAAPFAALLAQLIRSAPDVGRVPDLAPSPPWAGWDHRGSRLWPDRDDEGRDLNEMPGSAWVDAAASRVRRRMSTCGLPLRIGHGDWESQNIRWEADRVLAVHDWDSVIAQPEAAIVGLAAAVWPAAGDPGEAATVGQSSDFIAGYQTAAGAHWTDRDTQLAWAAGLWVRLFNARKDAVRGGGPQLDRLAAEIDNRLSLADLTRDS
jgi:hypothetical protein